MKIFKGFLAALIVNCVASQTITRESQCGDTLGCYDDCSASGTGCTFSITWATEGSNLRFAFKRLTSGNSYIALGFSTDKKMSNDGVVECVTANNVVNVYESFNPGYSNSRLASPQGGISSTSGSVSNGVLQCSFLRGTSGTADTQSLDLNQDYYLLVAQGIASAGFAKSQHNSLPFVSSATVDLQQSVIVGASALSFPLVKAHGSLMVLAWMLTASVGMIMARFYKPMWPEMLPGGVKVWFQFHRICMMITVLSASVAFILIFVESNGYSKINGFDYQKAHPIIGIISTILMICNPIMAIFRPSATAQRRPIFNWAHFLVGRSAFTLAIINIFFGMTLVKSQAPDYIRFILAAYVVWQLLVEIVLEVLKCMSNDKDVDDSTGPKYATPMFVIIVIHIIVVAILTFTVIGLLVSS